MFQSFVNQLKNRLQQALPGEDTQFLMAPVTRERIRQITKTDYHPKKSAVLILLFPDKNSIQTVLIQRPEYDGVHSGQVAFPGGKFEETDIDLKQTALREATEEIGVVSSTIEIIGHLTDVYISPSNFLVTPFIGCTAKKPDFTADVYEVQKVIVVDLFSLNNVEIKSVKTITHSNGYKIKTPYYDIEGLTVWGATAMMISELNAIVAESKTISF
jgi:8-oxo-dGTP pyrophosphatase MutT (NUDIX family)